MFSDLCPVKSQIMEEMEHTVGNLYVNLNVLFDSMSLV